MQFWFDFASPYSYLSAMRIDALADRHGVHVTWKPLLLGAIFREQGWTDSPFRLYPAKGRYSWRDLERRAAIHGLPLTRPAPFPQNSLLAARLALVGLEEGWGVRFARLAFDAQFRDGRQIGEATTLAPLVRLAGGDEQAVFERATSPEIKERLRAWTRAAMDAGIFGAPTFIVEGEPFWGDDHLEEAFMWAMKRHPLQLSDGSSE